MSQEESLIQKFREKKFKLYIIATGAAAKVQYNLWKYPGAGDYLVGAEFPYDTHMTDSLLGYKLGKGYLSDNVATELAMRAYSKCCEAIINQYGFIPPENIVQPIGIGVSAAVASNEIRRSNGGFGGFYLTIVHRLGVDHYMKPFSPSKGQEARDSENTIVDAAILNGLADLWGFHNDKIQINEALFSMNEYTPSQVKELFFQKPHYTACGTRDTGELINTQNTLFMPGTFDPIHDGHRDVITKVEKLTGKRVTLMVTADSVHKEGLSVPKMLEKVAMMRNERFGHYEPRSLLFTQKDPLFIDKALKYPNAGFVVGVDAIERMLDPKWGQPIVPMLHKFRNLGTKFYISGRKIDNNIKTLKDINIPETFEELFIEIPNTSSSFSSTEIRKELLDKLNKENSNG